MTKEQARLIKKAVPFLKILKNIKDDKYETINNIEGNYVLLTTSICVKYDEILNTLRNNKADFVYIDGFNENGNKRFKGLFCTDGHREIADTECCFVVGDLEIKNKNINNLIMTAEQLYSYMGENAEYMICICTILNEDMAFKLRTQYLANALYNTGLFDDIKET